MSGIEEWDALADWWEAEMGDGDDFHRQLLHDNQLDLLAPKPGERILDLACGQGAFSLVLANRGANVVGVDGSARMLGHARRRCGSGPDAPEFHHIDLAEPGAVLRLGTERFDSAVCGMALQDIGEIDAMVASVPKLLKPGGAFVCSVPHPAFNSLGCEPGVEYRERDGRLEEVRYVHISDYLAVRARPMEIKVGQNGAPMLHHRPLGVLFESFFAAGFCLDALREPAYPAGLSSGRALSWKNFPAMPPALVFRWRIHEGR